MKPLTPINVDSSPKPPSNLGGKRPEHPKQALEPIEGVWAMKQAIYRAIERRCVSCCENTCSVRDCPYKDCALWLTRAAWLIEIESAGWL